VSAVPDVRAGARRPDLDTVCQEITSGAEGAIAFAVARAQSGDILGFHGDSIPFESVAEMAKTVLALFRSPHAVTLEALALRTVTAGVEPFVELRLVSGAHVLYAKLSAEKRHLFLLVTEVNVSPAWGWKEIRSAQRRLESMIQEGEV
jgi:hypothetical protein